MRPKLIFGQIALRFERSQLRALLAGVEFDEDVAFLHCLAGLEINLRNGAGQVRADHHAVNRLHGADHDSAVEGHASCLRHDAGHRLGRRRETGSRLHRGLHLLELYEAQGRQDHSGHDQHQDHSLRHECPLQVGEPYGKSVRFRSCAEGFGTESRNLPCTPRPAIPRHPRRHNKTKSPMLLTGQEKHFLIALA